MQRIKFADLRIKITDWYRWNHSKELVFLLQNLDDCNNQDIIYLNITQSNHI